MSVFMTAVIFAVLQAADKNTPAMSELEASYFVFTNIVAIEAELLKDPQFVTDRQLEAFPVLNPELAIQTRQVDPATAAIEAAEKWSILHAQEVIAELRKDPEFVRREREALQRLQNGAP